MSLVMDILATLLLLGGLFFMLAGAVGIVRLPDTYHRLHAISKCSSLGLLGLLLAAVVSIGTLSVLTKAVLTLVFAFVATPVGSHILAKAALSDRAPRWSGTLSDEWEEYERGG
ncbi:MAG: monovalent cation/H(+) antiporter subunit G [Phycisphaeraceae bacterium]